MQRRPGAADNEDVQILGFWIATGLVVAIGYGLGGAGGSLEAGPRLEALGVVCLVVAIGLAGVAAARASCALGAGRRWMLAAVGVALLGRGVLAATADDPDRWPGARGIATGLRTLRIEGASHPGPRCRVRVEDRGVALWLDAPPSACPLAAGQRVRVRAARMRRYVDPELPGDPAPAALARAHGAVALAVVDRVWPAGGEPSAYWTWVARQRQRAWTMGRRDRSLGFVVASSLGVRSALRPEDRVALRRAGLGHLIAVSGLHVGLAAWALLLLSIRIGARVGGGRSLGVLLSWVPLVGYVLLTGASPPAVRAGVMAMGVGLGGLLGRPHHGPVLLAATSTVMLIVRPAWAFDPGFQLSVAAMASLVRAPAGESLVRQTWRVTWVVLPLSLLHFGHAGVWGVLSNLLVVPIFTVWVLPLGLLGWVVGGLVPSLATVALAPAGWGAAWVLDVAELVAGWPSPPRWSVALVAVVAATLAVAVGRRDRHGRLHPRWAWLPPLPVALAVVVAVAWPRTVGTLRPSWWAAGSPRAPAVVTVAPHDDGAIACVHAVSLSPSRWPAILDALELDAAGWAGPSRPRAPHEDALVQTLRARGRWIDAPRGCPDPPSREGLREELERCRRLAGTRHVIVAGDGAARACFVRGRWIPT